MRYRAEIDGLRAIAVVPVLFFHAGFTSLGGGFAGVDVFFVISGYLITSILYDEISKDRFSLVNFYERRARRLAPPLFFICLVCMPFAWMWMLPSELDMFGKGLYHVNLFVSNFLFRRSGDYFALNTDLNPLLHTWSLAVEEQFYLLFPVVLLVLRRFRKNNLFWVIGALSAFSFLATQIIPIYDPVANFYLLPSRFWELGLGALLAIAGTAVVIENSRLRSTLALAGLLLIVLSYSFLSASDRYPGWGTLPVVIGTILVLAYAGPGNWAGKILSHPLLVTIGLWSYSLYLWHQPLFAFARLRLGEGVTTATYIALIAACFVLAFLTHRFVETPFRNKSRVSRRTIFSATGAFGVALIAVGLLADKTDGFSSHFKDIAEVNSESFGLDRKCNGQILAICQTDGTPEIAVWGDSFAMHLVDGMLASQPEIRLTQMNKSNCGPLFNIAPIIKNASELWPEECLTHNEAVKQYFVSHPEIRYAVVSSSFLSYVDSTEIYLRGTGRVKTEIDMLAQELVATLDWLKARGIQPVVFAPPPYTDQDVGLCAARARKLGIAGEDCRMPLASIDLKQGGVWKFLTEISEHAPVLDMRPYLCGDVFCEVVDKDVPVYQDKGHLSRNGSRHLGRTLNFYQSVKVAATQGCLPDPEEVPANPRGICVLTASN